MKGRIPLLPLLFKKKIACFHAQTNTHQCSTADPVALVGQCQILGSYTRATAERNSLGVRAGMGERRKSLLLRLTFVHQTLPLKQDIEQDVCIDQDLHRELCFSRR